MKNKSLALTSLILLISGFVHRILSQTNNLWHSIPKNPEPFLFYPGALITHHYDTMRNFLLITFILIIIIIVFIALLTNQEELSL